MEVINRNKEMTTNKSISYLELIIGPMFSGKTSRIVEIYNQCKFCNISVDVINHSIDTRYDDELLSTHDKIKIPCIKTHKLMDLLEILNGDVILINEGQFFSDLQEFVNKLLEKFTSGFHIHAPCGATPKDGPSAGAAFTLAFISILLNKKINNECGITGEIELTGKVTKIGGLISKLQGAERAGIKKAYISIENIDDINEIKEKYPEILRNIEIQLVERIKDCESIFVD